MTLSHGEIHTKVIRWHGEALYYEYELVTHWDFVKVGKSPIEIHIDAKTTCTNWDVSPLNEWELNHVYRLSGNNQLMAMHTAFVRQLLG